jgi:hypothetical protein
MTALKMCCVGFVALLPFAACQLDERALVKVKQVESDAGAGGAPDQGPPAWVPVCGEGGAPGEGTTAGCWAFDGDTDGWKTDPGITAMLNPDDAAGNAQSGSLAVTNAIMNDDASVSTAGAFICVPVSYPRKYDLELAFRVPSQAAIGGASVQLQFVNTSVCQGISLGQLQFDPPIGASWEPLIESGDVPHGTNSVIVRLLVSKARQDASFVADFDQIRIGFE